MTMHNLIFSISADQLLLPVSGLATIVFLYVGPDQILPLASVVGAVVGVLLIVWHRAADIGRKVWRFGLKKAMNTGSENAARQAIARTDNEIAQKKANLDG